MYWSMPLKDHFKVTNSNKTVTNHLVKNKEILLYVCEGSYHHLTFRSKTSSKIPLSFTGINFQTS